MKKQTLLAIALSVSAFSFSQKGELKLADKAIKKANFAEAKTALSQVEPMLESLDEKSLSKYKYLKGAALFSAGAGSKEDMAKSLEYLDQVKDNNTYKVPVRLLKEEMAKKFLSDGNEAYENKKFAEASTNFEGVYNLRPQDTTYLYYAAATAINAKDYKRALPLYEKLKNLKYTGVETKYYAVNGKTNEKEAFPNKQLRDASVKAKQHNSPTQETSPSKRADIVKNVALMYISNGEKDKAILAIQDARTENPEDVNLIISEANIYYEMGDTKKFKELLETATQKDPNNAELQYNLGVISAESNDIESAKKYYAKAIELNPKSINSYINSAAIILDAEQALIEEMNNLGSSAADNRRYDQLKAKRHGLYQEALPFLTKALEIDSKNVNAASTLMNIYSALGETAKFKEMKALVASINAGN